MATRKVTNNVDQLSKEISDWRDKGRDLLRQLDNLVENPSFKLCPHCLEILDEDEEEKQRNLVRVRDCLEDSLFVWHYLDRLEEENAR